MQHAYRFQSRQLAKAAKCMVRDDRNISDDARRNFQNRNLGANRDAKGKLPLLPSSTLFKPTISLSGFQQARWQVVSSQN